MLVGGPQPQDLLAAFTAGISAYRANTGPAQTDCDIVFRRARDDPAARLAGTGGDIVLQQTAQRGRSAR